MEKRTKLLLEQQQKSVLKDRGISFETIKDISVKNEENLEDKKVVVSREEEKVELNPVIDEKQDEVVMFKNKVDIEKELFDEFNNSNGTKYNLNKDGLNSEEEIENKKLPDVSLDEYMKNFDENEFKESDINSLFDEDDLFPNIPI